MYCVLHRRCSQYLLELITFNNYVILVDVATDTGNDKSTSFGGGDKDNVYGAVYGAVIMPQPVWEFIWLIWWPSEEDNRDEQ